VENYPSINGSGVIRYYEEKFGILPENIVPGNGSTELIYLIPRALGLKRVAILTPSYHDYERASILAGANIFKHPLSPVDNFSMPSLDELIRLLDKADSLWMGRPNNPTGAIFTKESLLELSARFPGKWFIVDEAFIQFLENLQAETLLIGGRRPNILVIHSLTKFYSLAGLRLGAVVGHSEVVSRIKQSKEPWTINGVADRSAPLLLECSGYEHETRAMVRDERSKVFQYLARVDGVRPFPGTANFILCQWNRTRDLDDLLYHLLSNGVYVRDCRNFPGLESNFFRVGLRTPAENARLLSLIGSYPGA
jgi:threonine-phosphate decarboxylase